MPPITLPVVDRLSLDNSILQTMNRCPRLAYYNYVLNRAANAKSYPITFGVAYHRFREILEQLYQASVVEAGKDLEDVAQLIFEFAAARSTQVQRRSADDEVEWVESWQDPPLEHKKSYLDYSRLMKTYREAFDNWLAEKRGGAYVVLATEAPFELDLPGFAQCLDCKQKYFDDHADALLVCDRCQGQLRRRKFSGRIDQTLEWNGRLWGRDFKTTGRKDDFKKKFNPDHQFTGYSWALSQLSNGRRSEGFIIDVVYNIKTKGPEFYPTLASRTRDDVSQWLEWVHDSWAEWESRTGSGIWTMRTSACNDFGGCFFREACNSGNWKTVELWLNQNTIASSWDPLNPTDEEGLPEG